MWQEMSWLLFCVHKKFVSKKKKKILHIFMAVYSWDSEKSWKQPQQMAKPEKMYFIYLSFLCWGIE